MRFGEVRNFAPGKNALGNTFYGYRRRNYTANSGKEGAFHGVVVGDCVHGIAIENSGNPKSPETILVQQLRPNAWQDGADAPPLTQELPGGFGPQIPEGATLEEREHLLRQAVDDELAQEVGRRAGKLVKIGSFFVAQGLSNEVDHVYLATDLRYDLNVRRKYGEASEEHLRVRRGPFLDLYRELAESEDPIAAQTFAAMTKAALRLDLLRYN